jgi:hypothetical protein
MYHRHVTEYDSKKNLSAKDSFELIYLRHDYFRKVKNPAPGRLEEFEEIVKNMSKLFFAKNQTSVKMIGMELEDIQNIFRVFVVSFIGMSGLYENPDRMEAFNRSHKAKNGEGSILSKDDIFKKERYDLARFLRQRMSDFLVKITESKKSTGITGYVHKKIYLMSSEKKQNFSNDILFMSYKKLGYKKINKKTYLKAVLENSPNCKNDFITKKGAHFKIVHIDDNFLTEQLIESSDLDPRNNMYLRDPEEEYLIAEEKFYSKQNK